MVEEPVIAFAQVIETWITISIADEAILRALSMTGKFIAAFPTLTGKGAMLDVAESLLFRPIEHFGERLLANVAKFILGENEMIARINVSVVFHHSGMSAIACKGTNARRYATPVGKRAVEEFDKDLPHIVSHPLVEKCDEEITPLVGSNRRRSQGGFLIGHSGKLATIGMRDDTLYNGCKLEILATYFPKKLIEFVRMVGIGSINYSHRIPFDLMLLEQLDASHHLAMGRAIVGSKAILVVVCLRAIDRDAHQPTVVMEKPAPFVVEQGAIGLDTIAHTSAFGISTLIVQRFAIETNRPQQRFSPMPGEDDLGLGLCLDVLPREQFEQFVAHLMMRRLRIEPRLLKVVAIAASEIALCTCRLRHHVERF